MFTRRFAFLVLITSMLLAACEKQRTTPVPATGQQSTANLKKVKFVIDWQPSAEYYGIFFAKEQGRFAAAGFDVDVVYGKGAPAVAAEIGAGQAAIGTTTSDNLVRSVARGGSFSFARPLISFNPAVVISLDSANIKAVEDLRGKTLGTNPESSVYSQFLKSVGRPSVEAMGAKEDPTMGYGGIPQLRGKRVDAILGYTTNIVIDLQLSGETINEIFLGDRGVQSYGVVLVATGKEHLTRANLTEQDIASIGDVVAKAYVDGSSSENIDLSVAALKKAEPQLDAKKLQLAIQRIRDLNSKIHYPLGAVDQWVEGADVSRSMREKALSLYK